ncbi:hypothetical protein GCM10010965_14810 [Caldalkalibacillus thermarum]|nr:hypothetical protein GCM10010965_14810 [Caldalkalibacillus thermarum]
MFLNGSEATFTAPDDAVPDAEAYWDVPDVPYVETLWDVPDAETL